MQHHQIPDQSPISTDLPQGISPFDLHKEDDKDFQTL